MTAERQQGLREVIAMYDSVIAGFDLRIKFRGSRLKHGMKTVAERQALRTEIAQLIKHRAEQIARLEQAKHRLQESNEHSVSSFGAEAAVTS